MAPDGTADRTPADERSMRVAVALFGAAVVSVAIAALAGLVVLVAEPAGGSAGEAALGITAAVAGLATAGFVIACVIYLTVSSTSQTNRLEEQVDALDRKVTALSESSGVAVLEAIHADVATCCVLGRDRHRHCDHHRELDQPSSMTLGPRRISCS